MRRFFLDLAFMALRLCNPCVRLHKYPFISIIYHNLTLHIIMSAVNSGTFPCGVAQCKTCKFMDSSTVISAPKFTYTSTHLIYCISCSRCGMFYTGETGKQLRTRFYEHRCAVSANDVNQPVSRHLNSGSHCISDIKIRVLCPISGSNNSCKRQEMHFISKLGTVHPLGINKRFSVTCLSLTCSDIGRSNPTFVFIVLLALCMFSHITPFFNPAYKI